MEMMRNYLLSIAAAAIICALVQRLLPGKGSASQIGRLLCGVFLLFTVLRPVCDLSLPNLEDLIGDSQLNASIAIAEGEAQAKNELRSIIAERVSAYILDKAAAFDAQLRVEVMLSEDTIPVPVRLKISGHISPYGKRQLEAILSQQLGISGEDLIWI